MLFISIDYNSNHKEEKSLSVEKEDAAHEDSLDICVTDTNFVYLRSVDLCREKHFMKRVLNSNRLMSVDSEETENISLWSNSTHNEINHKHTFELPWKRQIVPKMMSRNDIETINKILEDIISLAFQNICWKKAESHRKRLREKSNVGKVSISEVAYLKKPFSIDHHANVVNFSQLKLENEVMEQCCNVCLSTFNSCNCHSEPKGKDNFDFIYLKCVP